MPSVFLQGLALSLLSEGESDISYSVHILVSEVFDQDSVTYGNYSLPISQMQMPLRSR